MEREYLLHHSSILNRDMEMLRFGNFGPSMVFIPTSKGRFYDAENFGFISNLEEIINSQRLQIFCIDSLDAEHLYSGKGFFYTSKIYQRLLDYYDYIHRELTPFINESIGSHEPIIWCGASFGAYHAMNIALRHHHSKRMIGLGGSYKFGSQIHDPIRYVETLREHDLFPEGAPAYVEYSIFCGKNDFLLHDSQQMYASLKERKYDVSLTIQEGGHDWESWGRYIKQCL